MRIAIGILVLMMLLLQACTDVAITGAQLAYNRRNITKNFSDHYITREVFLALNTRKKSFKDSNITIATFNKEVLLAGQTPDPAVKEKAGEIAKNTDGVKKVYNLITVASAPSVLTHISDSWITTKIKAKLIAAEDVDPDKIKVVTDNGTVYLMGTVQPEEAEAAVEIARTTDGVQGVVKIFSYLVIKGANSNPSNPTA